MLKLLIDGVVNMKTFSCFKPTKGGLDDGHVSNSFIKTVKNELKSTNFSSETRKCISTLEIARSVASSQGTKGAAGKVNTIDELLVSGKNKLDRQVYIEGYKAPSQTEQQKRADFKAQAAADKLADAYCRN